MRLFFPVRFCFCLGGFSPFVVRRVRRPGEIMEFPRQTQRATAMGQTWVSFGEALGHGGSRGHPMRQAHLARKPTKHNCKGLSLSSGSDPILKGPMGETKGFDQPYFPLPIEASHIPSYSVHRVPFLEPLYFPRARAKGPCLRGRHRSSLGFLGTLELE